MNILQLFGILSGLLSALCYLPYIKDMLSGETKPERASWLIWTTLGLIAFFSQLNKGATDSLWMTGVQTVGITFIFLLSLKKGVGGFTKRDISSLIAAAIGLILWYFTHDAAYALILVILIDSIGSYLTAIKSYEHPESETLLMWILAGISGFFAILSVGELNIILLAYPIYVFIINIMITFAILLGRKRLQKK